MKFRLMVLLTILFMAGCATKPQLPIQLANNYYTNDTMVVGVYLDELPKPNTFFPGASCLLCAGVAEIANSSLTAHTQTLDTEELALLDDELAKLIQAKNVKVVMIEDPIKVSDLKDFKTDKEGYARKNFTVLKERLAVDKLIVIDINTAAIYRNYSSYVPISGPLGTVMGEVYSVDLVDNKYEAYEPIDFKVAVEGEWDEPPVFPGVTNAYYQAIDRAKEKVKALFE